ncbi:MAG: primosomal protein N' [Deltaproteobacteria bacterium]|nr:primosomal protein N' [Deltaproteobacteria bacterium]
MTDLVQVAVFAPIDAPLTYQVPARMTGSLSIGQRVEVPLGGRRVFGVIVGEGHRDALPAGGLRPISELLDDEPTVEPGLLSLCRFVADYYLAPLGEVLRAALPNALLTRAKLKFRITQTGRAALAAQDEVLARVDQALTPAEARLLVRLRGSDRGLSPRSFRGADGNLLRRLTERGFVDSHFEGGDPSKPRSELAVRLIAQADLPERLEQLAKRAPRQAELLKAVAEADGQVPLRQLAGTPELARRLAERGLIEIVSQEVRFDSFADIDAVSDTDVELSDEQRLAMDALSSAVEAASYRGFLLQGVTGSGKTEVYLRVIGKVLERQRTALVLVPEIALTPQLAARFRARFGDQVAVLHSALSDAERYAHWLSIKRGNVPIVVGARSAVFAPLSDLGAVIVDEEHDGSFKQEEGVRYNARDLALVRAKAADALAILGSATPSFESRFGADCQRLTRLVMAHRATPHPLPEVASIDLRRYSAGSEQVLSAPLASELEQTLQRGEQAILFLNRRGFSPWLICKSCGFVLRCEHCSVSLTHHKQRERMVCHYCGYNTAQPEACSQCGASADRLQMLGLGTERVENYLRQRFADARIARLDRDTASARGMNTILRQMANREIDILVGTQMVTKGHDFPFVTLVGVVCADLGLHFPDFRAGERTFQLLTQVAGRAGRGERRGRVVIQTLSPQHPAVHWATTQDYEAFFAAETASRRELSYPPFGHLVALRVDGPQLQGVADAAQRLAVRARRASPAVSVLGPAEAPLSRLKGRFRWMLLLKSAERRPLRQLAGQLLVDGRGESAVRVTVDVDPMNLL